jgi:hypothetical protein
MSHAEPTLAELERILDSKKRRLAALHRKRDQLERRLESVTSKIARIEGARGPGRPRTRGAATNGRSTKAAPVKRAKNDRPLREVITDVLKQSKKGLSLSDLAAAVLATGYQTTSTNFKNTMYQTLYNNDEFQHDKQTGLYRVEKMAAK